MMLLPAPIIKRHQDDPKNPGRSGYLSKVVVSQSHQERTAEDPSNTTSNQGGQRPTPVAC
jgi:hypothetical protein